VCPNVAIAADRIRTITGGTNDTVAGALLAS
jgi:hypothetical protein